MDIDIRVNNLMIQSNELGERIRALYNKYIEYEENLKKNGHKEIPDNIKHIGKEIEDLLYANIKVVPIIIDDNSIRLAELNMRANQMTCNTLERKCSVLLDNLINLGDMKEQVTCEAANISLDINENNNKQQILEMLAKFNIYGTTNDNLIRMFNSNGDNLLKNLEPRGRDYLSNLNDVINTIYPSELTIDDVTDIRLTLLQLSSMNRLDPSTKEDTYDRMEKYLGELSDRKRRGNSL
jgi:hypothetical protein